MYLIVGLGNPGDKYHLTRHNIGFQVIDYLAAGTNLSFQDSKWHAKVAKTTVSGSQALLVKPQTYMNKSGISVGTLSTYFRVEPQNIIVIHDDLDLGFGRIKIVTNRGAGGHNGITSIIQHLGCNSFVRIRFGIGRPLGAMPVSNFVLSPFTYEEMEGVDRALSEVAQGIGLIVEKGVVPAMNVVNRLE